MCAGAGMQKTCLPGNSPQETFVEFVNWVLLQCGSPFTISKREEDLYQPTVQLTQQLIKPSMEIESEPTADPELELMPTTDHVPELMPSMELKPRDTSVPEDKAGLPV